MLKTLNTVVIGRLESFFYRWGEFVATHPKRVIGATLAITGLCCLGLLNFDTESDGWRLWLGEGSDHIRRTNWRKEHFVNDVRGHLVFLSHEETVLNRESLLILLDIHEQVWTVEVENKTFADVCMEIPITDILLADKKRRRKRRQAEINSTLEEEYEDYFNFYGDGDGVEVQVDADDDKDEDKEKDYQADLPTDVYCDLINTLEDKCGEYSLLEIWKYDREVIGALSEQDIIDAVNTVKESPVFGYETEFLNYLGGKVFNETGHVVSAKAVRSIWIAESEPHKVEKQIQILGYSLDVVDQLTMDWEAKLISLFQDNAEKLSGTGYVLDINAARSFTDESSLAIAVDVLKMMAGYGLMFGYTLLTLGKLNRVEHKMYLAIAGIVSIQFGVVIGLGISMMLGILYTPIHGVLPFFCLGLGIDDMFVIMRCWNNLPERERKEGSLAKNMAVTMRHAGISITVTSITDVCAFGIGAVTAFPGLRYFCLTSVFSIASIFLLQTSWFLAWMTLDQKRMRDKRDGFFPCIVHKNWTPSAWSQRDYGKLMMSTFSKIFKFRLFQALVMIATLAFLCLNIYGSTQLPVEYHPKLLIPNPSYVRSAVDMAELNFLEGDDDNWGVTFYTEKIPYTIEAFEKIEKLVEAVDESVDRDGIISYGKDIPKAVSSWWERSTRFWWTDFKLYLKEHKDVGDWKAAMENGTFSMLFSDFLHHEDGAEYELDFRFESELECGLPAPNITSNKLGAMNLLRLVGVKEHAYAKSVLDGIIAEANLTSNTIADSIIFPTWEIEIILAKELWRNLGLTLLCILVTILVLLADLRLCLMVFSCVTFTAVDVCGITYFLGLTIDQFHLMSMVLGIGLSVDYSAHIAQAFKLSKGSKVERTIHGFTEIGPAIIHGGVTTLLALVFLGISKSHTFKTFFKVVSLMVTLGLFHGLVYLPVCLTLFGPNNEGEEEICAADNEQSEKHADMKMSENPSGRSGNVERNGHDNPDFKSDDDT